MVFVYTHLQVWKRFTHFEQTYGDLASMLKVVVIKFKFSWRWIFLSSSMHHTLSFPLESRVSILVFYVFVIIIIIIVIAIIFFLLLLIITKPCQLFCTLIFRNYLNKCFCMGLLYVIRYRKVLYHILIDCSSFLVLCYLSRGLEPVSNLKFCWRNVH